MRNLRQKHEKLENLLNELGSLIVSFSGGVDSGLLLRVAHDVLGERVLAVTADSPSVPRRELGEAVRIAESIGARHLIVRTGEMENRNYANNPPDRCYFCKSELYSKLLEIARRENIEYIANGTNLDDLGDYRPGLYAAQEYKIISPLKDAGLTKNDVRALAKELDLEIWNKPASPCLSSRIPYGREVTLEKLAAIEAAEDFIRNFEIKKLRVRHFGRKARIETDKTDFKKIDKNFHLIAEKFRSIGFDEIELTEFKSGSLNLLIDK